MDKPWSVGGVYEWSCLEYRCEVDFARLSWAALMDGIREIEVRRFGEQSQMKITIHPSAFADLRADPDTPWYGISANEEGVTKIGGNLFFITRAQPEHVVMITCTVRTRLAPLAN